MSFLNFTVINEENINLEMGALNMDKHITTPITGEVTKNLRSGDYVYITGTIYVARDAAHKRMIEDFVIHLDKSAPAPPTAAK